MTDSNPEPKMDKVSQEAEDQEEGADSPANGLDQPLFTEVPAGAGIWRPSHCPISIQAWQPVSAASLWKTGAVTYTQGLLSA